MLHPMPSRLLAMASVLSLLATCPLSSSATAQPVAADQAAPLPDTATVLRKVRENLERDVTLQARYTYIETRRRMRTDEAGVSHVAEEKVFEVYPDQPEGEVYRRLIGRNGVPLTPEELELEDARRQRALRERATETAAERAKRLQREAEERRKDREEFDEAMRVFDIRLVGFDTFEGRRMLLASLTPREHVRTQTRAGNYLKRFAGHAWITADDYQLVKLDLTARETINIGWGLIGRIHEGSRATFRRTRLKGGVWMPERAHLQVSGRALLVKPVRVDATIEYSNYRQVTSETGVLSSATGK
jgi:hypothetical protein